MPPEIDLVVLSRDDAPLAGEVARGIEAQKDARLRIERVIGGPLPEDINRWQTIARARNEAKRLGNSEWIFFLDDDVVLPPGCVSRLQKALERRPAHGALAADYLGEYRPDARTTHVGMGATLFRRSALRAITFRWKPARCECQCCCDDLRRLGYGIDYEPKIKARHLKTSSAPAHVAPGVPSCDAVTDANLTGHVLAAFDRFHFEKFRRQFLTSLRASGNDDVVRCVAYGLYPSQQRALARLANVRALLLPRNEVEVPVRRLLDFQAVLEELPPSAPAAYWDAGDVVFQSELTELWNQVRAHPNSLLAAPEGMSFMENLAMQRWTLSINSTIARRYAWEALSSRPVINSGFAAGTVGVLKAYFQRAHEMRHSAALVGTSDWGDQMALNLYCQGSPSAWHGIGEGWNFCIADRSPPEIGVDADGYVRSRDGIPIHVVHGNAQSLRGLPGAWRIQKRLVGVPA